jgi:hypothetical protein
LVDGDGSDTDPDRPVEAPSLIRRDEVRATVPAPSAPSAYLGSNYLASMTRPPRTGWIGFVPSLEQKASEIGKNVSHQRGLVFGRHHQNEVGEHFRDLGSDFRKIGFWPL